MSPLPWGGSEELWAETGFAASQAGYEVFVSVVGWANPARKLRELERRGAKILRRYNRHFPSFGATSSYRDLFKTNPDVLVISQASRAERQLATKIPNSDVVLNPVNLSDRSYLPRPDSETARMSSISRLSVHSKGQDFLIAALSADQWKQRDWHLTIYGSGPDESYYARSSISLGCRGG